MLSSLLTFIRYVLRPCSTLAFTGFIASGLTHSSMIDSTSPRVIDATNAVIANAATAKEKAILIHDFVRDEVKFGFSSRFYADRASDVLETRVGFCNTKTTLFIAMLRVAGIEARQRFVNIDSAIVRDFVGVNTSYVDHSYAEVKLDGRWLKVDSYIVDQTLADRARARLKREGKVIGFGVHRDGTSIWDGANDAFSQYVNNNALATLSTKDYGVFDDVAAFYASGNGVNELPWLGRLAFGFVSRAANEKIDRVRRGL